MLSAHSLRIFGFGQWLVGWLVGWLVSGAPTFMIWHHSLIHSHDLAPLIFSVLVVVSGAKVKALIRLYKPVSDWLEMLPLDSTGLNM